MNALTALHFDAADVRMFLRDGEPWWVHNDICAVLEIVNPRHAASRLRDWQKGVVIGDTLGGSQTLTIVNESGLYKLVLSSRKPVAEAFERWLTTEVLPSIRKFGMYPPPSAEALALNDPYDGVGKPSYVRFKEERLRWEVETGLKLRERPGFTGNAVAHIERGLGKMKTDVRVTVMTQLGMDVLYILTGQRTKTPQEREFEKRMRAVTASASLPILEN